MTKLLHLSAWPLAILFTLSLGLMASAQEAEVDVEVRTPKVKVRVERAEVEQAGKPVQPDAPQSYWIGILGGDVSPALRSHLGLEGAGVLVREVVSGSPAEQGGIKQWDILLTANGRPATSMATLAQEVVKVGGTPEGKIVFDLLRTGAHQQSTIVPAIRPATPQGVPGPGHGAGGGFDELLGKPFKFRLFGPGAAVGGANVNVQGPGNTSVQVQTKNGQTQVKVSRDGKTWEFDGADPKALQQLPEDLQAIVAKALGTGVNVDVDVEKMMPDMRGLLEGFGRRRMDRRDERLMRRLEALQRQMEELQRRLGVDPPAAAPPAAAPEGEAPPFDAPRPPAPVEVPAEIELPVEEGKKPSDG